MAVQERLVTASEFAALPDDGKRHDLVKGVVVEVGRPKPRHNKIQVRFARFLGAHVDDNNLGLVTTEGGYVRARNPDTVRGPDVGFISNTRLPTPDLDASIPMAPDLAVEIVSPGDSAAEIVEKTEEYFAAGTRLVWVVYPDSCKVYVYHSTTSVDIIAIDGVLDGGDILPGFKLSLREIFKGIETQASL